MKKKILILSILVTWLIFCAQAQPNLLVSPGFESWINVGQKGLIPTGWTIHNSQNGTISQNTDLFVNGSKSCRIASTDGIYNISQSVNVTAGKVYSFQIAYYIESASTSDKDARIACYFRKSPTVPIAMSLEDSLAMKGPGGTNRSLPQITGSWKTYSYDVVAPAGATTFFLSIIVAKGATVSWDSFSFSEKTTPSIYKYTYAPITGFNYSPTITGLDYFNSINGPSEQGSFTVRAYKLNGSLLITAPTNFEISATSGASFVGQNSLSIPSSSGFVIPITIYVRLKSNLPFDNYSGNISLSAAGATTELVPVSGKVGTLQPILTPSVNTLYSFSYAEGNGPSAQQSFTVSGINLVDDVTILAPQDYEISTVSGTSFSGTNTIKLTHDSGILNSTSIYVRLKSGLSTGEYSGNLYLSSGSINESITLTGSVKLISVSTNSLTGFSYNQNEGPSQIQSFTVSGIGLSGYLIVSGQTNFEISVSNGSDFSPEGQILLAPNTTTETPIYVRLKAGLTWNTYNENISISSSGVIAKMVSLSGSVLLQTGTEADRNTELRIYGKKNELIIEGSASKEIIYVFNLLGVRLKSVQSDGGRINISVPENSVYIVKTSTKTTKVIL